MAQSDIMIVTRSGPTPYTTAQVDSFRDGLAAELSGHGFSTTVRSDRIANDETDETLAASINQARQMGADYVLITTLGSLEGEIREFSGHGVKTSNLVYELSFSYRLLQTSNGNSLIGSTGSVSRTFRESGSGGTISSDPPAPLLRTAAQVIANDVSARISPADLTATKADASTVTFRIQAVGMGMTLPEVVRLDDDSLFVTGDRVDVVLNAVTVLLDGIVVGTAPGEFEAQPGLQELTLEREGFGNWNRTINVRDGLNLSIRLSPTPEELNRFKEEALFLEDLRTQRALTDAEVERIEGIATMLRQSGYRWDVRVETDEGIRIEQHNRTIMGDNPSEY